jgi:hypothetical protein
VFDDRDRIGAQDVVVINQAVARRLWPNTDPVGQVLMVADAFTPSPKVVIGVVGDTRHHDLARDPEPEVYRSAYQAYWPFFGLVVRADRAPDTLERAIRSVGARLDKSVPLSTFQPLGHLADTTWAWRRSSMAIVCVFAAAAGFLAFVGVYGVMAYSVAERSREIGVRMALGASPADIAARVLQHGAVLTCAGTAIGLTMSTALGGLLAALLFGVTPLDAATFAAVSLLAVVAGLTATAIPAFVAARVDPSAALAAD